MRDDSTEGQTSSTVFCRRPCEQFWRGRKHGTLRPHKTLRLIRDGKFGRSGIFIFNTYSLHVTTRISLHFNVSFIVWATTQDSVLKPQFLKRKESRSGSNQAPAYQPIGLAPYRSATPAHWSAGGQKGIRDKGGT